MTYREKYQQLHPEEDVSEVHLDLCPDVLCPDISEFRCPALPGVEGPGPCCDCWDSEIPGTEAAPPKSEPEQAPASEKPVDSRPTARILVEVIGDTIHTEIDGVVDDLVLCALAAAHMTAKEIYDSAEDKLAAEKLIHEIQNALSPTGKIWSFDDE